MKKYSLKRMPEMRSTVNSEPSRRTELNSHICSEKGTVLLLTLVILAVMTALVVEFAYEVYTSTESLSNWKESQRLSVVASSGVTLALKQIEVNQRFYAYTYPGKVEVPLAGVPDGSEGILLIRAEDENARFNLNSLVWPNGTLNDVAYLSAQRLFKYLDLDDTLADRIADWIDKDSEPRLSDSEDRAKNAYMESVDELLLLPGVNKELYRKVASYVTVYGLDRMDSVLININTALIPVIISLDIGITEDLADRIIAYRDLAPFESTSDIVKVAGFEGPLGQSLMGRIAVKSSTFRITSIAEENGITRIIETVQEIRGGSHITRYWREI